MTTMTKFQDMNRGQWFREVNGSRVMLKLQNQLPSGFKLLFMRVCLAPDHPAVDPSLGCSEATDEAQKCKSLSEGDTFNAIDSVGVPCFCPPWLEFELIENPRI